MYIFIVTYSVRFDIVGFMQNQSMTLKHVIEVPKRQVFKVQGKKIKDALNILIRVLE